MKSAANATTPPPALRRSGRVSKNADEAKAKKDEDKKVRQAKEAEKQAKKATKEALKKQQATAAAAAAESVEAESSVLVTKKKTASKRKRSAPTMTGDSGRPDTAGEEEATASYQAESSTRPTTQEAAAPPAPAAGPKKPRTNSKKAAAAAAMTIPIPEDSTAAGLADLMQVQARLLRALKQRMYVVNRERKDAYTETFDVLGSIGNLYKVTVGPRLACSCRDFRYRRNHCKHIFLVLARVFHLTGEARAYQSLNLTPKELEHIFACCTPDPCVLASEQIQQAINDKKKGKPADIGIRRPLKDADCPICYEELDDSIASQTVFCATCGNNIHKSCFEQWTKSLKSRHQSVTCVFCRSEWHTPSPAKLKKNNEGYVNFQAEAGLPTSRDTSTYGMP